jgi:monoamine oxidase
VTAHYNDLASFSYPTGDRNLLGSNSTYGVGQYTEVGGYERAPQGQVYFAGEHTSYNFQGYMKGGAESA